MSSHNSTAPSGTHAPKEIITRTQKYNFTKTILPAWEKTRDHKRRCCTRLETVSEGLEAALKALEELPDSSQKKLIAKKLTKIQPQLNRELEVKRYEAAQAQRFTTALSDDSTVVYNKVGFNNLAVLLQVLNHEEDKDAKVRHVLAAVQASMTMLDVLPDGKAEDARGKVC
jgi:hypothetical protein